MNESEITSKIAKSLRDDFKATVFKIHGHGMQQPGIPDMYVAHKQFHGWLEAKSNEGVLSILQRRILFDLVQCGENAYVIRYYPKEQIVYIETYNGFILAQFSYKSWTHCAEQLLDNLYRIVYGIGTSTELQSEA